MKRCFIRASSAWSAQRSAARREVGATAIEYAMMICMVALGILALVAVMGGVVSDWFSVMATSL